MELPPQSLIRAYSGRVSVYRRNSGCRGLSSRGPFYTSMGGGSETPARLAVCFLEYKWVVLTVTTVGIFMATLDSSILVVGLPQVVLALNTNLVVGVWFITVYRLMITVLLVGIGRIADLHGRVRLYNMGFAIFGTYWSRRRLKEISQPARGEKFDLVGALSFSSSITLLLLGLTIGSLTDVLNLVLIVSSGILIVFFFLVERRTKFPVLDLSLFRIRLFTAGNIANLLSGLAFAGLAFVMTLYFQLVRGYDPLHAGIFLIPLDATLIFIGPISGSLSDKWGARGLSTIGLVVASIGFFVLSLFDQTTPYVEIAVGLVLVGFGIGLFRSPNASSVMGSVPASKRVIASGVRATIINTSIVASIPLVLALMTADVPYQKLANIIGNPNLITNVQTASVSLSGFLLGLQHALLVFSGIILVSAVFSLLRGSR